MRKKAKAKEAHKYTNEKQVKKEKVVRKFFVNNGFSGSYFNGYNKKSIFDPLSASPTNLLKCV